MAYSTVEQVREVLKGVSDSPATDYDLTSNLLTETQIEADIADADSQIDSAVGARYAVPFEAPTPPLINTLSINIASYLADLRFRGGKEYPNELSPFYLRYQRATRTLNAIADGRATVPGAVGLQPPQGSGTDDQAYGVVNPYAGRLMRTKHIFTRWPEGIIRDD